MQTIDNNEIRAVTRVLKSGLLSGFIGRAGPQFYGGKEVQELESMFKDKFNVKYAVAMNSATAALDAAVCALGIGHGDEVIVTPYSFCSSATAVLMNGAKPVFADIDKDTFCLDPKSVLEKITAKTKAIIVVNLFGGPANYKQLLQIAKKHNIKIIEDNAQAAGGTYNNKPLGTIGDIGVFSLNQNKTIHCGEGGVLVTNNEIYAFRAQLRRNHGEVVEDDLGTNEGIIGYNYRMTELEAAVAKEQLKKMDRFNKRRVDLANYLTEKLKNIDGLTTPFLFKNSRHVYYMYAIKYDESRTKLSRKEFVAKMADKGFRLSAGYVKPLYMLPIFKKKNHPIYCPNVENLWSGELVLTTIINQPNTKKDVNRFIKAIKEELE